MQEVLGPIALGLFGLLFVVFAVLFIKKSRRRRREMFSEELPGLSASSEQPVQEEPDAGQAEVPQELPVDGRGEAEPEEAPEDFEGTDEAAPVERPVSEAPLAIDPKLQAGLQRTHDSFMGRVAKLFGRGVSVDPTLWRELEEALLTADVGAKLSMRLIDDLQAKAKEGKLDSGAQVRDALKERMLEVVKRSGNGKDPLSSDHGSKPRVIMFVGVNGVGKTTTIGKIATLLTQRGQHVVLAAGDTFRAAATEQLSIWGERAGCKVITGETGKDPASVIYNAVTHAVGVGADVVLADTAGRLHTKTELMDEIRKVKRATGKAREGAPDEIWLVVDATTGQNAVRQAEEFHQALGLTGVILTKLDGTAKGGVVVAIAEGLGLPVVYVGVGEAAQDLRPFDAVAFIEALFAG